VSKDTKPAVSAFGLLALAFVFVPNSMQAQAPPAPAAKVWEAPLVIPTYELGAPDPNPAFMDASKGQARPVYPYPMLDSLTNRRVDKSYKAVYLENEYLKVTVLPELGGHLYAIYDKTAKRDILYTNHVVKYGIVGIRGAWVSGGIEWNFPDGHTVTTISPIDYATRTDRDGSASVTVGDTERIQRMQWAVTIRLRPGWKYVETEVRLNNRRETPGRYWYWATAAAKATGDMRFAYPMREAYPHVFWPVFTFPQYKGVDLSLYRDVTNPLSLFARNSMRDFMSVYYDKSDWGVVHVADHREVPGKKTWTWGTADSGNIWVEKLTDKDGQYVEFQAGRYETQMEHQFLAPHRVEHFTEYWFPVDRLGGIDEANRNASLRVAQDGGKVRVGINANSRFPNAVLTAEAAGQKVFTQPVNLTPTAATSVSFDLPAAASGKPLAIRIATTQGRELITWRSDTPYDGNPEYKPATKPATDPAVSSSAEQAYVQGVAFDKKSDERNARPAYEEALKRDPGFAPAHVALGLSYYRSGEYDRAEQHFTEALQRNVDNGDAHYYLGLTRRAQGRSLDAKRELLWAVRSGYREQAARFVLGELALAANEPNEAIDHLSRAVNLDPRDLKARTVLAMAERLGRKLDAAQSHIDAVVDEVPIDYLALSEQHLISKARGRDPLAVRAQGELWRLLSREPDAVLELAFDYSAAGRDADARSILEQGLKRFKSAPMLNYTLGWFYGKTGEVQQGAAQFAVGAKGDYALVFPHRVEEIAVLKAALDANSKDGRAWYYLGNALANKVRDDEAVSAWRQAIEIEPSNAVAHRNLGQFLTGDDAVAEYEKAIQVAPGDFHLYLELDKLFGPTQAERRIKLLEGVPDAVRTNQAVIQVLAAAYADAARYEESARLLVGPVFTAAEGENSALAIYRRAHAGIARKLGAAGDHQKAADEYLKATEYPRNLSVGRPNPDPQGRFLVLAARELEAAGQSARAEGLWKRAAEEGLKSPGEPQENWSENYYYKAVALDRVGRKEEARTRYTRLANLNDEARMQAAEDLPPTGATRWLLAGLGLKGLGQNAEAKAALDRALQMEPSNEVAKEEMAGM
jgi:tetratricopeptide (TPR) repeat protein